MCRDYSSLIQLLANQWEKSGLKNKKTLLGYVFILYTRGNCEKQKLIGKLREFSK